MKNPHGEKKSKSYWGKVWSKFNKIYDDPQLEEGFNLIVR